MKETIRYDACDENSWDRVGREKFYPISNSCGQLGQSYQDYHCSDEEKHMECPVDKNMEITAVTNARWWGAPGPLTCGPKSKYPQTGYWDYYGVCDDIWANPPKYCTAYEGQKGGVAVNDVAYANGAGRTDVEGCCWWGRGVIQTTGICNFGKLNYFLGKRAADEGRDAKYPDIDFCRDPEAICSSKEHKELKWIAGFFYWVESVQAYDEGGWSYMDELHKFVDGGMQGDAFINSVSGIVNRGCHNPPCGTGELDGGPERAENFNKIVKALECAFVEVPAKSAGKEPAGGGGYLDFLDFGKAKELPRQDCATIGTGTPAVEKAFLATQDAFDNELFLYETPGMQWVPSSVYRFSGLFDGLKIMHSQGIAGRKLYVGGDDRSCRHCHMYGLVNVAAFLAQAMKETIRYDACDENSWDRVGRDKRYPISNSCGQLGQSYQDYHCSDEEKHMECQVDPEMTITAVTNARWWGAPGPLTCGPKSKYPQTGYWDYTGVCDDKWANPPKFCTAYEGQKGGTTVNDVAYANGAGRTDVEGCCWWGRGVIQTTGICNFGKLNYFLGKRAADEGREAKYPDIDFCRDPEAICSSKEHQELKWIAGFFYWVESVQAYDEGGWSYVEELHKFVNEGMQDDAFINAVSGIVNRGCHNPPCGTGDLDGGPERVENFQKVLSALECAFVPVDVKTPAPVLVKEAISTGFVTNPGGREKSRPVNRDGVLMQPEEEPPEEPPDVSYECGKKISYALPPLRSVVKFFYELYIDIDASVGDCLKEIKKLILEDVAIVFGCSSSDDRRRRLQGVEVVTQLASDESDLPNTEAEGCTSEFQSALTTTCTPVKGQLIVSFMPDTTNEVRKYLVDNLKSIVQKGMESGRYEGAHIEKAVYVGNKDVYIGGSETASSESNSSDESGPLLVAIYCLAGLCLLLFVAFILALRRKKGKEAYYSEETSFGDFMMESGDTIFGPQKDADKYGWRQGFDRNDVAPRAPEAHEAYPPQSNPRPRNADARDTRSRPKKSRSQSKRTSQATTELEEMEAQPDYLNPLEGLTFEEESLLSPHPDTFADQMPLPDEESSESGESSGSSESSNSSESSESNGSTDSSSRRSADASSADSSAKEPSDDLQRASNAPSPSTLSKEERRKRLEAARKRAKRRPIN